MNQQSLKPLPSKVYYFKDIYGLDIETYDRNRKMFCCSIVGDNYKKIFLNKDDTIKELAKKRFRSSIIAATNLSFDYMGLFHKTEAIKKGFMLWRGSDMILCKMYSKNGNFVHKSQKHKNKREPIVFLDTLNYAKLSVEKIGKLLKLPKLKKPSALGRLPKNKQEREELITYNFRDSEISQKYIKFLYNSFIALGATPKITIAATAMNLFQRQYLKFPLYTNPTDLILDQLKAYYGGRVEAIGRGPFKGYNYYDFNSLYPWAMLHEYPNPNRPKVNRLNTLKYIEAYPGVANVDITAPDYMEYPFLPVRGERLLFPLGSFSGWYTNLEINKAIDLGYVITRVKKCIFFRDTFYPFKDYITDLYKKRLEYKESNNPMQQVVKLLMNSTYGKFSEKFFGRDNIIPIPETVEELHSYDHFERVGKDFIRIKEGVKEPKPYCIPIFAAYTTAYARIKLHDYIRKCSPIYFDTDSLITKKSFIESTKLGGLKREYRIKEGMIVKPKFYALRTHKGDQIRIKGFSPARNYTYEDFLLFLDNTKRYYNRFAKFRESLRRDLIPNEIIRVHKELTLDDQKRDWNNQDFSTTEYQISKPLILNGETFKYFDYNLPAMKKLEVKNG